VAQEAHDQAVYAWVVHDRGGERGWKPGTPPQHGDRGSVRREDE